MKQGTPADDASYLVARLDELDEIEVADVHWRPIRRRFGIKAFGVNAYTANEGETLIESHSEEGGGAGRHDELYVVIRGSARFVLDGARVDAPAGMLVFVREGVRREAIATDDKSAVLAVGGRPDEPFRVSPWEFYFAAAPALQRGEYTEAVEIIREGLEVAAESGALLYQLACAEALAGRRAEALEHVRRAFELEPRAREWAADDEDLSAIRDELDI